MMKGAQGYAALMLGDRRSREIAPTAPKRTSAKNAAGYSTTIHPGIYHQGYAPEFTV
jgi:hypothetical protein